MKRSIKRKAQRGVALITAILMSIIFLVLIGALMAQIIAELGDVGAHSRSAQALDAAYAGVENMTLAIEESAAGGSHATPAPVSYSYPAPSTVSYSASVTQAWNTTSSVVYYLVTSTGTENNSGQERVVTALVQSQPYSYFEQFTAGNSGSVYYVTGEHFDGPVYNGGTMNVWYQTSGAPIFNSTVQTVTTPSFYQGAGKAPVAYSAVNWGQVMALGQNAFTIGANPMQLPTWETNVADASEAFYGNSTHTTLPTLASNGLYINGVQAIGSGGGTLKSGMYIQGDVTITPTSPGTNNEVFTLATFGGVQGIGANYTVTIDFGANTTTVTQTSGCVTSCTSTYTGVLSGQPTYGTTAANGAIFVNGDIKINSGTIHGDYSMAVPDYKGDSGDTITLQGAAPGILYKNQTSSSTDELGIWANDIKVSSGTTTGYEFDGSILTGYFGECPPCTDGDFSNTSYNGAVQGTFTFRGGLVQNINGAMGISSGGTLIHGFDRQYIYDPRLAANPPPGFPITNRYSIVAWQDQGT